MRDYLKFYINGEWKTPDNASTLEVINPADESVAGRISMGTSDHVDQAANAASQAFNSYYQYSRQQRVELLQEICTQYKARMNDMTDAIIEEMGAPRWLASSSQALSGYGHFKTNIEILNDYAFNRQQGDAMIIKEPIGVCGLITPWNWPINQISCKLAPALATGCTVVWKPSEIAPFSAQVLMEILDSAGVPDGVVNMLHGYGPEVGAAISAHPLIQMVSFTGSTRAGVAVAKDAADTVKRVTQELGGKSPNIILDDLDETTFAKAVAGGMKSMTVNSGQNCNAPSRMLVPAERLQEAVAAAKAAAESIQVGHPNSEDRVMGPVISAVQWDKIQDLIQAGIDEGATLVAGGTGKPDGLDQGYYVKPTVFANVHSDMRIAREEIFGPVLSIMSYTDDAEAIRLANDTPYGLSGYVSGADTERLREVVSRLRAGMIHVNGAPMDRTAPFGGYKQSGNGREKGLEGFDEFLETKSVLGIKS
ncbi:aldehyde dehydrogenase family protein [Marinicella sp. W31]|uniref:aldehyde dehydrogenase family protein n=1 Tax=Marinicella sp. W31 TaxID=3023713 RepID=UPI00375636AD